MKEQFKQFRGFAILATMILIVLGASVAIAQLPDPGMQIDPTNTALVVWTTNDAKPAIEGMN